jgi:hypothetical protein
MIVYPITLPDESFQSLQVIPENIVGVATSPWTGQEQVFQHQGQLWRLEAAYPSMQGRAAEPIITALASLQGRFGSFLLGDTGARVPRGTPAGAPVVDGAAQTGNELATRGWTASAPGVLLAGDYLQVGSGATQRLHKVLVDADADAGGLASIDIWPRLRESPADGAAVVTSDCKGVFRLADDSPPWQQRPGGFYDVAISAREAI